MALEELICTQAYTANKNEQLTQPHILIAEAAMAFRSVGQPAKQSVRSQSQSEVEVSKMKVGQIG